VFVLWLRNQHYDTRDVIEIRMTYRDLPYYEGIRTKTHREYKLHKIGTKIMHTLVPLEKQSITWFQFIVLNVSQFAIQWHVQPYTAHVIPI